jgi:CHAT domain-containing protein/tetratricopeptide (TPR) repeat protein
VQAENVENFIIVLILTERGKCLQLIAPRLLEVVEHPYKLVLLQTMAQIQDQRKPLRFAHNPDDGEIRASIELPLEDAILTERQFNQCLEEFIRLIDGEVMPRLKMVLETGEDSQISPEKQLQDLLAELQQNMGELEAENPETVSQVGEMLELLPFLEPLQGFVNADSWGKSQRIVKQYPILLEEKANHALEMVIKMEENEETIKVLRQHQSLLQRCREIGIDEAFQEMVGNRSLDARLQEMLANLPPELEDSPEMRALIEETIEQLAESGANIQSEEDMMAFLDANPELMQKLEAVAGNPSKQETRQERLQEMLANLPPELEDSPEMRALIEETIEQLAESGANIQSEEDLRAFFDANPELMQKLEAVMGNASKQKTRQERLQEILANLPPELEDSPEMRALIGETFEQLAESGANLQSEEDLRAFFDANSELMQKLEAVMGNPSKQETRQERLQEMLANLPPELGDSPEMRALIGETIEQLAESGANIQSEEDLRAFFDANPELMQKLEAVMGNPQVELLNKCFETPSNGLNPQHLQIIKTLLMTEATGNEKQVFSVIRQYREYFNPNLAKTLEQWLNNTLTTLETSEQETLAGLLENVCNKILQFPLGCRPNDVNLTITGYQLVLKIRTVAENTPKRAQTLNNLGNAYLTLAQIGDNSAVNLNKAIEVYDEAAGIRRGLNLERDLSQTLTNLGNAYLTLAEIGDNSAVNLNKAIEVYDEAAGIRRGLKLERDLSSTLNNLGVAYRTLAEIGDNSAVNLNKAIEVYDEAAGISRGLNLERDLSQTLTNLGNAYLTLAEIGDNSAVNLNKAIEVYDEAAGIRRGLNLERDLSSTLNNLGNAYLTLAEIGDNSAVNLNKAIEVYDEAAGIFRGLNLERDLSSTLNNLGVAYLTLAQIGDNSAVNLNKAIEVYDEAAGIFRGLKLERDLSYTLTNLGNAYCTLAEIGDNSAVNLNKAIEVYDEAAGIFRGLNLERDLSDTLNNLGNAYLTLAEIGDNSALNLNKAIEVYKEAAGIRRGLNLERDLSQTLTNLGVAYRTLAEIGDNSAVNLNKAIEVYRQALTFFQPTLIPTDCRKTGNNLGNLAFKQGWWEIALEGYEPAIQAVEKSRNWAKTDQERQNILADAIGIYDKALQCYINLKRYDQALLLTERARSRHLVELMYSNDLYSSGEIPPEIKELLRQYESIQAQINQEQANPQQEQDNKTLTGSTKRSNYKTLAQTKIELDALYRQKEEVWQKLRSKDQVLAEGLEIPYLKFEELQSLIAKSPKTALMSYYSTNQDTYLLILRHPDNTLPQQSGEVLSLHVCQNQGYRNLQTWIRDNWLIPYSNKEIQAQLITYGEITNSHLEMLQKPLKSVTADQENDTLTLTFTDESNLSLPLSEFEKIAQANYPKYSPNYLKLRRNRQQVEKNWRDSLPNLLEEIAQKLDFNQVIQEHLTNIEELIIIPHIYLHLIPFAALPVTANSQTEYLGDCFQLRILPSAQILSYCHNRQAKNPYPKLEGADYGTVEDATGDLTAAVYECEKIAQLLGIPDKQRLKGKEKATLANYLQLIQKPELRGLHSSHHAASRLDNPLESALILGDGKLTLGQLLSPGWRMENIAEIFLSCCETHLGNPTITDDIIPLTAGFLCAGAQNVVSTLWAVNSLATALFCLFYYENRNSGENRVISLQQAQQQLRKLTGEEIQNKYLSQIDAEFQQAAAKRKEMKDKRKKAAKGTPEYQNYQQQEERWDILATTLYGISLQFSSFNDLGEEQPFNNPAYWSAFVCQGI